MKVVIVDGYVDEPACFGVPPYVSPYPRYVAGAFIDCGLPPDNIHYMTIDQIRSVKGKSAQQTADLIKKCDVLVLISGMTVPGKYIGFSPITSDEIVSIMRLCTGIKILGGPIRFGYSSEGRSVAQSVSSIVSDSVFIAQKDIESFVYDIFCGESCTDSSAVSDEKILSISHRQRTNDEISRWSRFGSFVVQKHPQYPNILCEIETYRGCGHKTACSFCTEPMYGVPDFRPVKDVVSEVSSLYECGVVHFRIGRQPDLFVYSGRYSGRGSFIPNPDAIKQLYSGIRTVAPDIRTLHMDNGNPVTLSEHPDECASILKTIVQYHTPGDIVAMGMESADPKVIFSNDLKADPEDVMDAVRLVNRFGRTRGTNGMPELLPGLNFLHGLIGESKETFRLNYDFLQNLIENDLWVRRINIRQAMIFSGTKLSLHDLSYSRNLKQFHHYKDSIRKNIDMPMLRRIVPIGTVLKDVFFEQSDSSKPTEKITFGRQFGTYPLLIGVPERINIHTFSDVLVTGHGFRSITAVPFPLNINNASASLIRALPSVNSRMCDEILIKRPFSDVRDLIQKTEAGSSISRFVSFNEPQKPDRFFIS